GPDPRLDELTVASNANKNILGPNNPFSYFDGMMIRAQGGPLFLDEFPRYAPSTRDIMLGTQQESRVTRGAMPRIPLNSFIIYAGNLESLEDANQSAGNTAFRDRTQMIQINAHIHPLEIMRTMVMMASESKDMEKALLLQ